MTSIVPVAPMMRQMQQTTIRVAIAECADWMMVIFSLAIGDILLIHSVQYAIRKLNLPQLSNMLLIRPVQSVVNRFDLVKVLRVLTVVKVLKVVKVVKAVSNMLLTNPVVKLVKAGLRAVSLLRPREVFEQLKVV
ncbi:uncharacterized protein LOC115565748 isoform X2 [Drosophila navojoa]|uniref:uncharacterized protein LOC115565748 isoform X2 n=1 Tax=Drosophila navojoa TaxID=7232 RepID=UPI0011BE014D|nr:uncharacterized protein LOC115565748 isoform X2 [Drosophila navojoa]